MTKSTFGIVALVAAIALAGALTLSFMTTARAGSEERGEGVLHHFHEMLARHFHSGGHHHNPMSELIEQLQLTPEQAGRLEKIHALLENHGGRDPADMAALHDRLVAQLEAGRIEALEIRALIDEHVDQIRGTAYAVTDEMIALINGLNAEQREMLLRHLQAGPPGQHGHGR